MRSFNHPRNHSSGLPRYLGEKLFTRQTTDLVTRAFIIFTKPHIITNTEQASQDAVNAIDRFSEKDEIDYFLKSGRLRPLQEKEALTPQQQAQKDRLMAKALRAYNVGEPDEAKAYLEDILEFAPNDAPALILLEALSAEEGEGEVP